MLFLSTRSAEDGPHELDFRFERYPEDGRFLFAHHGARLGELLGVCGLPDLGQTFYVVRVGYPFSLEDAVQDAGLIRDRYGVEPTPAYGRYLRFDREALQGFAENAPGDDLDCTIVGIDEPSLSERELHRFEETLPGGLGRVPLGSLRSWFYTHDNHFCWLAARPPDLLRRLIEASLVGFINHVRPHNYASLPGGLIDLLLDRYHTAPVVCFPTRWDHEKMDAVPHDVQVEEEAVHALLETGQSHWIAYQLNPPKDLIGRQLAVSYQFGTDQWSYQAVR